MKRIAVLVAVLGLVVAACGNDGSAETVPTGESSTTAATEPPATTAPVEAALVPAETTDADEPASGATDAAMGAQGDEMTHGDDAAHGSADGGVESTAGAHEGADTGATGDGGADRIVGVTMTELAFTPDEFMVTAGETIRFEVINAGEIVHEFRLSNEHRIEEHVAGGHEGHGDDTGGHHGDADVILELEAGESGEVTVTFPEDTTLFTEVACLIPGHYEAGMNAPLSYS